VRLSDAWDRAIAAVLPSVAAALGLPAEQLEARLYKLLVYEKGGFFLPHRDSEKHDRMVASLIVVLPQPVRGGKLLVRHGAAKEAVDFADAAQGQSCVLRGLLRRLRARGRARPGGVRVCLAYNLVLKPGAARRPGPRVPPGRWMRWPRRSDPGSRASRPAAGLRARHHYTQRGLSVDLFKGKDRQLADLLIEAADKVDCHVHLAQVSRHLQQFADDGQASIAPIGALTDAPRREIEIGETTRMSLAERIGPIVRGKKQPWGENCLRPVGHVSHRCRSTIGNRRPRIFEGYTGNAGNTSIDVPPPAIR